jgi:hypothetical protein
MTTVREGVSSDRGVASNEGILTGIHVFRQQAIIGAVKSNPGPPMTLGNAATPLVWLLVSYLVLAPPGLLYKAHRYHLPPGWGVSKYSIRAWRRLLTHGRTVNAYHTHR